MTEICVTYSSGIMRGLFCLLYLTKVFLHRNETPNKKLHLIQCLLDFRKGASSEFPKEEMFPSIYLM